MQCTLPAQQGRGGATLHTHPHRCWHYQFNHCLYCRVFVWQQMTAGTSHAFWNLWRRKVAYSKSTDSCRLRPRLSLVLLSAIFSRRRTCTFIVVVLVQISTTYPIHANSCWTNFAPPLLRMRTHQELLVVPEFFLSFFKSKHLIQSTSSSSI